MFDYSANTLHPQDHFQHSSCAPGPCGKDHLVVVSLFWFDVHEADFGRILIPLRYDPRPAPVRMGPGPTRSERVACLSRPRSYARDDIPGSGRWISIMRRLSWGLHEPIGDFRIYPPKILLKDELRTTCI